MTDVELDLDALEVLLSMNAHLRHKEQLALIAELRATRADLDEMANRRTRSEVAAMVRVEAAEARMFELEQEKEAIASLGLKQWSRAERAEARVDWLERERADAEREIEAAVASATRYEQWWREQRNERIAAEARIAKAKAAYDLEDDYEAANAMYEALTKETP